ncbi:hypothetical protein F4815DRAFT_318125 [Daldinia loculata]|nr:hypothetical protein F4815DRAFT_318125 [Daldinia loculata]
MALFISPLAILYPLATTHQVSNTASMECQNQTEAGSPQQEKPLLITSSLLSPPPYVLDPQDLPDSFDPFPGKIGSQFRQVDEDTLVKYGPKVSLAEAEAMDYISRHTSIKCPKVLGAYVRYSKGEVILSCLSSMVNPYRNSGKAPPRKREK